MPLTRRSFLKSAAVLSALPFISKNIFKTFGAPIVALTKGPGNKWPGRVVINFNKTAALRLNVNQIVVKNMVDESIKLLTNQKSIGAAWKTVFPASLTIQSKIAIKINILNPGNPAPHPFSVMAITEGIQQMNFNGNKFPAGNITIYDGNNMNSMNLAGFTEERFPNINRVKDTSQIWGDGVDNLGYVHSLHACDFLINVFSPIGHLKEFGGFDLGFKSQYGSYSPLHVEHPQAYMRDINCKGPIFKKTVLNICSGIFGKNEGVAPSGEINDYTVYSKKIDPTSKSDHPTTIIMSTDPISCEFQAIKMMRLNNGKSYAIADLPDYLKASGGIGGALSPVYNIGVIDERLMDVRRIVDGNTLQSR
jgi:hypothetical protein